MAKKQKLINYKKNSDFQKDLVAGELLESSIIFVVDTKKIFTHNTEFDCSGGGSSNWDDLKNKPFGEEIGSLLYQNENVEVSGTQGDFYVSAPDTNTVCPLEAGKSYRLTLDDQHYDLVCKQGGLDNAYLFLTDGLVDETWQFLAPNGGYIFFRCGLEDGLNGVLGIMSDDPVTVANVEIHELEVKLVDPKFLPIVQTTGGSENKVMSQSAITEELNNIPVESNERHGFSVKNADNINTGQYSTAEGSSNKVSGKYSHVEGKSCNVSGDYSHAEGESTKATGNYTHAEGFLSQATGKYSHAEGNLTKANGIASHAEGEGTITNNQAEHASGMYNVSSEDTLFSVGNGEWEEARHNAIEVKQNGDVYIANTNATGETAEKPMIKLQDMLIKTWEGTQAEYDAIVTKDPNTFYFIKEN